MHTGKHQTRGWPASATARPRARWARAEKAETRAKVTKARAMAKIGKAATMAKGLAPAKVSGQWGLLPLLGFRALL